MLLMPVASTVLTHSDTNLANAPVYDGLIALAGGGQPNATLVNSGFNIFTTVATAADTAQLQVSSRNKSVEVSNQGAASLRVWTNQSEPTATITAPTGSAFTVTTVAGQGAHIEIAVGANARIVCGTAGSWKLLN